MTITETDGRTYGCCLIKQLQYQEKLLYLTTLGTGEVLLYIAHGLSSVTITETDRRTYGCCLIITATVTRKTTLPLGTWDRWGPAGCSPWSFAAHSPAACTLSPACCRAWGRMSWDRSRLGFPQPDIEGACDHEAGIYGAASVLARRPVSAWPCTVRCYLSIGLPPHQPPLLCIYLPFYNLPCTG